MGPLGDLRVMDLTQGICGPFCTQILRDLGAEIIKIEPPQADISRKRGTRHGDSSIQYIAFNRGKKSVILDLESQEGQEYFLKLSENMDVIVEDLGPEKSNQLNIGYEAVRRIKPDILYLSITGYGHKGIFRDYAPEDGIIQALSGFMSITGEKGGEYMKAGSPLADGFTGIYGVIGVLAAILYRNRTKESLYMDVAKLNVMLTAMPDTISKYLNTGITTRPKGCRHQLSGFFGPAKAKDGYVICMAGQDHQFNAFTELLGLQGLEKDERFDTMHKRCVNADELEPIIFAKTVQMTVDELTQALLKRKIPAGPVYSLEKILESDYVRYHKLVMKVVDYEGECWKVIGSPMKFSQFAMPESDFLSHPGEYTEEILGEAGQRKEHGALKKEALFSHIIRHGKEQDSRPLAGIRILDLTRFMAGPLGTEILENLGAEVIKIERMDQRSEFSRSTEPTFGTTSAYFMAINSGKKDIGLNLNKEEHREIFLKLAAQCDVVADNFRPGVTEKLRITYEDIKPYNPEIICSTVSGFGYTGAWRTRGCVDTVAQAMSGLMSLTGYEDGGLVRCGSSVADVCASLYEAVAILASIIYRDRTGKGGFVDSPMISSMLSVTDGATAEYLNHGICFRGVGNRDRNQAFFQTLPVRNGSVMVEAVSKEHFAAFAEFLGKPELAEDERFKTLEGRMAHREELERILEPVTRAMTMTELAEGCRRAGVPAGEVNTLERISRTGYMEEQGMVVQVHDSQEGVFKVLGLPIQFDRFELPKRKMVPQPGEHTAEVLKDILGILESE